MLCGKVLSAIRSSVIKRQDSAVISWRYYTLVLEELGSKKHPIDVYEGDLFPLEKYVLHFIKSEVEF